MVSICGSRTVVAARGAATGPFGGGLRRLKTRDEQRSHPRQHRRGDPAERPQEARTRHHTAVRGEQLTRRLGGGIALGPMSADLRSAGAGAGHRPVFIETQDPWLCATVESCGDHAAADRVALGGRRVAGRAAVALHERKRGHCGWPEAVDRGRQHPLSAAGVMQSCPRRQEHQALATVGHVAGRTAELACAGQPAVRARVEGWAP